MDASFLNDDLQELREQEFQLCQQTVSRTSKTLTIGYTDALRLYGIPTPKNCSLSADEVHVCVALTEKRPKINGVRVHTWQAETRTCDMGNFQLVAPPVAWAQVAPYCSLQDHIAMGCMMMSKDRYRRTAKLNDFEEYLATNQKFKGRAQCYKTLPYLTAGTDSPTEANLLAFLSVNGIQNITPNFEVSLRNGARRYIDLAVPNLKLGLEYQGAYHSDALQMRKDANRMNQLIDMGWVIIQVTSSDMRTTESRNQLLAKIQRAITRQTALKKLIQNS
ncbi:hypothetical protein OZX62_05795 [Bifidobacterium sp. ESL0690]|uniref:endonuclease domain-containing protein n=1 Tax=Bifidobacterium sp. ESL0690 TaxID=2983214 RepID=UPI0023F61AAA|nr:hypothetical protein [Bifidobacterium sp. ESL0690]WEV45981.1 hypothetical protein OZX62_05795 [Bifidobacterium sp. ESL0690]